MDYTQEQVNSIVEEARAEARIAANKFFQEELGGQDKMMCGFAWVDIHKVKGNSKLGRMLKVAGIAQDWKRTFSLGNPSGMPVQNIDTKEKGAVAAAAVFTKYGFSAYANSRLD